MDIEPSIDKDHLAAAKREGREQGGEKARRVVREQERRRLREWYANLPQEVKDRLPPPF